MKKLIYILPFILFSCSQEQVDTDVPAENVPEQVAESALTQVKLVAIASDPGRVNYTSFVSRADEPVPGQLKLIAEIENPSEELGYPLSEGDRLLSATCVYYDGNTDTYYATYHMQGNNYSTQQDVETSGLIERFKVEGGKVNLGKIYRTENPAMEDFDFNHLYFDNVAQHTSFNGQLMGTIQEDRIIAVGHRWVPSSGPNGTGNSKAIIAKLDLDNETFGYKVVYTGEKKLDGNGKSLGEIDAQDVNCVVRRYDTYYLATRKGIALLQAKNDSLFEPMIDLYGNKYFIKTPGSCKHVAYDGGYSKVTFLYLTEDFPENFQYSDAIKAKLVKFDISNLVKDVNAEVKDHIGLFGNGTTGPLYDVKNDNFLDYVQSEAWNIDFEKPVSPVDGKNVLFMPSVGESQYYAALGKGGLYFKNDNSGQYGKENAGRLDFGDRPVNGVYAEDGFDSNNGYIYVANGSKLSIFNRYKLDEVASWNLPSTETGSANYVTVRPAGDGTSDRIVTVAYGQAGVKIFRFTPTKLW